MTTLLVASAGGHLQELLRLLPSLGVDDERVWVTYDVPQARSLLAGERVFWAHHPTTKNLPNAARNYQLARQVFMDVDVDRVISTGAGVAVPFMLRAYQVGRPGHYIESAARVDGPSLAARLIEHVPDVHLYRQLGDWGGLRWRPGPCVFDGVTVAPVEGGSVGFRKVLVSLGTHQYPFSALTNRLVSILTEDLAITWQLGSTSARPDLRGSVAAHMAADEMERCIAYADVVVGHAGVGLTLTALSAGKVPVLVPRRILRHEHTDDHQAQLARVLADRGLAVTAEVDELSLEHLERAAGLRALVGEPLRFGLAD